MERRDSVSVCRRRERMFSPAFSRSKWQLGMQPRKGIAITPAR
jgi:hypothetical protein